MNTISKIKINKTFGRLGTTVLLGAGIIKPSGKKNWFTCEAIPTKGAFDAFLKKAFTSNIGDVLENAKSEVETLRDELQDWYDNLPESFQSGDKGDRLQEAIYSLEGANADSLDLPDALQDERVFFPTSPDATSRSDRASDAAAAFHAVAEFCQEWIEKNPEHEAKEDVQSFADEVESAAGEVEAAEFPGMYS